ncbi:MAG: HepT-like ribonuclease domain-containing protein [Thermodesulfobacteriota bacterium]|nr:HepT-like ribonuclease domain-containing protein [Thermodesulfobacteriota bacterium]
MIIEYNNQRDFDAVMMNFIVIGEMVSKLSEKFIETHSQIDWLKIRGFRNIVAHNYFGIDAEEVWQIIESNLSEFDKEITVILSN